MKISNPPKAFILLAALASLTALMLVGRVTTEAGMPLISAVVFYAIGNGVTARSGKAAEPVLGPRDSL